MEKRRYGNTDLEVSVLGFGGAEIGGLGAEERHPKPVTPAQVEALLGSALDAGLNVIDTAECYNDSEELIGQAISHRRSEYYLFTKCGHSSGLDWPDWHPEMIENSIDRSLRRLRTDYLDVVHLHTCSEKELRSGEVVEVLQRMKEKGKVRYIGYSGDHLDALYAVRSGVFDSLMTSVNIADQEAITLTLPEAVRRGIGVTAKRPIANVAWRYSELPENPYHHDYWHRLKRLRYEFLQQSPDVAAGTALRFVLSVQGVHTAIVGTARPQRWSENARLLEEGALPMGTVQSIRQQWLEKAEPDWIGLE